MIDQIRHPVTMINADGKPGRRVKQQWAVARGATAGRGVEGPVAAAAAAVVAGPVAGVVGVAGSVGP